MWGGFLSEIQRQQLYDRYFFLGIIFIAFTILIIIILAPHAKEKWITGILNWMQKLQKYVPAVTENEPKNLKKTSQVKLYMFSCRSSICIILFFILKKIEFKLPLKVIKIIQRIQYCLCSKVLKCVSTTGTYRLR